VALTSTEPIRTPVKLVDRSEDRAAIKSEFTIRNNTDGSD
jgi:hypothetical protein